VVGLRLIRGHGFGGLAQDMEGAVEEDVDRTTEDIHGIALAVTPDEALAGGRATMDDDAGTQRPHGGRRCYCRRHRILTQHIGLEELRRAAKILGQRNALFLGHIRDNDMRSGGGQTTGSRFAEPTCTAYDQRRSTLDVHKATFPSVPNRSGSCPTAWRAS